MSSNSGYSGSDWLKRSLKIENMSPLGEDVADLLGDLFLGIYHLQTTSLRKVNWSNPSYITYVLWWRDLSTMDFDGLTRLVVLSHDRMIRVSIDAVAPRCLKLTFHKRTTRIGSDMERMPMMEEHVRIIRESYNEVPEQNE